MGIGMKIKELAEQKKVDAVWIAKRLGKTKQAVYDMFSKEDVNTSIIKELADIFDVPISYFFDNNPLPAINANTVKGNNNVLVGGSNHGTINKLNECEREVEILRVEVKHLTTQIEEKDKYLAEKERLINVLMDRK